MAPSATQFSLLCVIVVALLACPSHAFGAGNIGSVSAVEGVNWRHGDIEDVLLGLASSHAMSGKKFSKLDVKRVYFGNWLRDYSQAIDVGTVKYVSAKAITLLLWMLGFMSFGYGTGEFEVTMDRLGCYRPEDHIDNPKDYAENEDARQYDRRLRGPVDERKELAIDPETGLKAYIASENLGIMTSAAHVRKLFSGSIELGRRYARNKNKADLYEALRLLGTGCHCLEDYSAHSNYTELALIEMGEREVFPHVGRNTQIRLRGARHPVFPIITGTFGGVDFLHSVCGEFDDKATQSEIQELENTMNYAQQNQGNTSILQDLLGKIPSGMFGGSDEAGKVSQLQQNSAAHQTQNAQISPRRPEEWTRYLDDVQKQIYPILQFHDEIMQGVTETIEKIPILPDLLENLQEQLNIFVFSLLAPFVLPIINQIKTELNTGSSAIIGSSEKQQHNVFYDDRCTDPTHSMLSKDHFSNVLNEPAGKVAGQVLRWAVPQVIACWDDERIDVNRTLNRIIRGVLHHPALRDSGDDGAVDGRRLMFSIVEQWWNNKDQQEKNLLRDQLSREGVQSGRNHKPGVVDHGHGSGKPLGMPRDFTAASSSAPGGLGGSSGGMGQLASDAVGGGALGAIVGGLAGNLGGDILGGGLSQQRQSYDHTSYGEDGSRTETVTQYGSSGHGQRHGQAQYSRTDEPYGGHTESYSRFEESSTGGYHSEFRQEQHTTHSSSQSQTIRYGDIGGMAEENHGHSEGHHRHRKHESQEDEGNYGSQRFGGRDESEYVSQYESRRTEGEYGDRRRDDGNEYGSGHGRRAEESSYGRNEDRPSGGYGRQQDSYESGGYDRQETSSYGRGETSSYGRGETSNYGRGETSSYGRGDYGRSEEPSYGGGHGRRQEEPSFGGFDRRQEGSSEDRFGERREETYGGNYGEERDEGYGRRGGRRENEYESQEYGRSDQGQYESQRYEEREEDEGRYNRRSRGYEEEQSEY